MFKYWFHPVSLALTEKLPLLVVLETAMGTLFQTLFLAADTGVTGNTKNINTKTTAFNFIWNIISSIMSTKQILAVIALVAVVGIISFIFIVKAKSVEPESNPEIAPAPTSVVSTPSVPLLTWQDEAGFSFQYPEGTTINKHPEDNINYANLTLTLPDKSIVQITMSDKTAANAATATFTDNDVIVTITGDNKDVIVKSWQFVSPTPTVSKTTKTTAPAPASDDGDALEEE